MSMFLPTGFGQTQQPQDGVASITPASPETTSEDIALMQRVLSAAMRNPNLIPSDFMSYLVDYIQTQRLIIPVGQVFGFQQTKPNSDAIQTQESTTSGSYTDLATVGPTISGLSAGTYVVIFGAYIVTNTTSTAGYMSVASDTQAAADSHSIHGVGGLTVAYSAATAFVITLSQTGGNTLTAKYKSSDGTTVCNFGNRWMVALRVSS